MISLPIDSHLPAILEKFKKSKNLILQASPGSGKTTRVPAALLKALHATGDRQKKIIVLVPKRIAAVSAADRISDENGYTLGDEVGYHVRFEPVFKASTQLIFMTEGLFIKKASDENFWNTIGILIFDEFHERSSLMDMVLGLAIEKQILCCEDLKLIVMSATLNSEALQKFIPQNDFVQIDAPPHPLKIVYSTKSQKLVCDNDFYAALVQTAYTAWHQGTKDLLIFLPGLGEMRKAETYLAKKIPGAPICILHSSVKLAEQKEILKLQNHRRIILATDIAESSLTLPSVDTVVDSGLRKVAVSEFKIGFNQLELQRISLFSAKQRAGRAARLGPGTVFRLWHESDQRSMPEQIKPEILSSNLLEEILTLKCADVSDINQFSWLDRPPEKVVAAALVKLKNWKLLNEKEEMNKLGQVVQNLPLSLENSLLFFKLAEHGFKKDAAYLIACLETSDFSKIFSDRSAVAETDLDRLFANAYLPAQGQKIKSQLEGFSIQKQAADNFDFRKSLIAVFFEFFPYRIAKRKTATEGLSSLGRGVSLLPGLEANECDYYILLEGFNGPNNKTEISFAVGFSKEEFLEFSESTIQLQTSYQIEIQKRMIYKTESKRIGQFVINESAKTPLTTAEISRLWPELSVLHAELLLQAHPDYLPFIDKVNFLNKRRAILGYDESIFLFLPDIGNQIIIELANIITSLDEFFSYPLIELLLIHTPEPLKSDIKKLPDFLDFPSGKRVSLDYLSDNAPLVSVKIQDVFGWNSTPTLLDQRLLVTLELLAPNMRPTQITQNLKQFWLGSYFDIRKELKARYPKHPWPDNPAEFKLEKRK